jgi:lipopolysaccharide transport system permease protein
MPIYRPKKERFALKKEVFELIADLGAAHSLAKRLTIRDWKAQYRQSLLGVGWAFATPVLNTLVWLFLQQSGIISIADTGLPFAAYVFSGTMIWSIFTESVHMPLRSTQQARSMLKKINFPKEALLLSGLYKVFGNMLIRILLVSLFFMYWGIWPKVQVLALPFFLLMLVVMGSGIGIWLTPLGMLYHDVGRFLPYGLQGLMYISPVLFALPKQGLINSIMECNPLTPMILNSRNALAGLPFGQLEYLAILLPVVLIFMFLGLMFFRTAMPILIEKGS